MRLGCIIAILIAVTLHTSSTAFPETLLAILASNAPQDAVASVDADVERHLRRAKPGAGDNTGKRMLAVHGNPGSFLTFVADHTFGDT
ncbi:unnamed protein product [Peronospora belbahrii]|uniref:Uncharacterized protein n=1 Tax=Peronospora belbahrii TaxID=622444 RepID=A0AAU9L751_9STRA|nr:unnamed protein product [Peronospora belbahrii]